MRKRNVVFIAIAIVLLISGIVLFVIMSDNTIHSEFQGKIIAYEESEEGLIIVLDDMYSVNEIRVLINDETRTDVNDSENPLCAIISARRLCAEVKVQSEYLEGVQYDAYPVTVIELLKDDPPKGKLPLVFKGVILAYEETEEGLVLVIDNMEIDDIHSSKEPRLRLIINDETLTDIHDPADPICAVIEERQVGVVVKGVSEYWEKTQYDEYPITVICVWEEGM